MDEAAFLAARLDEGERLASMGRTLMWLNGTTSARATRLIETGRTILAMHEQEPCNETLSTVIRLACAIWSDHPDYPAKFTD